MSWSKQAETTNDNVVDVGLSGRAGAALIARHSVAVARQLGKHSDVIISPLLRPSFSTLGRIRRRIFSLRMLLVVVVVVDGGGGRCCSSLLGGSVDIRLVQFAPQQSMK